MGEICPRSDPDIAHMRYYLGPLFSQCTTGYEIWDNFNFPMLNPNWQLCKYGPHLSRCCRFLLFWTHSYEVTLIFAILKTRRSKFGMG